MNEWEKCIDEWAERCRKLSQQLTQAQADYEAACHLAKSTSEAWKQVQAENARLREALTKVNQWIVAHPRKATLVQSVKNEIASCLKGVNNVSPKR